MGVRRQIWRLTIGLLMAMVSSFIGGIGSARLSILGVISLLISDQLEGQGSTRLVRQAKDSEELFYLGSQCSLRAPLMI